MEPARIHSTEPTTRPQPSERARRLPPRSLRPGDRHRVGGDLGHGDLRGAAQATGSRKMTKVFKALSDNTRQQILQILDGEQYTVSEIVSCFDLSQPTISRHLSVLKDAELVVDRRRGQNIIYRLNDRTLTASMRQFFGRFRSCQEALR